MRVTRIAILIALCMFVALASAQEYSIRANRGLNLRTAPSRNAAIADTVRSGTILQVVGKFNRWLKIDYNGSEAWLADWVDYSRVDGAEPTGAHQPSAPIDNCCYVDRQCQSDQEWTDGYWAYQNGQCAAPAKPTVITLSRPHIEGSSRFVRHVGASLDWLESRAPEWYNYVINGMDLIFEVPVVRDFEDVCTALAHTRERKVSLETCWTDRMVREGLSARFDQLRTAEVLAHEACHLHTFAAGIRYEDEEYECHKPMMGVTVALVPYPRNRSVSLRGEPALSVVRRFCREGFYPELYCPAIQRLQGG